MKISHKKERGRKMNPLTQFKKISIPPLLIAQALVALTALMVSCRPR
jgi:hypothetical protein